MTTWREFISAIYGLRLVIVAIAVYVSILIIIPFGIGLLWYHFVQDAVSAGIFGVVIGAIADIVIIFITVGLLS